RVLQRAGDDAFLADVELQEHRGRRAGRLAVLRDGEYAERHPFGVLHLRDAGRDLVGGILIAFFAGHELPVGLDAAIHVPDGVPVAVVGGGARAIADPAGQAGSRRPAPRIVDVPVVPAWIIDRPVPVIARIVVPEVVANVLAAVLTLLLAIPPVVDTI